MEASGREDGLWPCAGPNAAQAQNRLARIVLAAMRSDDGADMDGLPIFPEKLFGAGAPQVNGNAARDTESALLPGRHWLPVKLWAEAGGYARRPIAAQSRILATVPAAASGQPRCFCRTGRDGAFDPSRNRRDRSAKLRL